MDQEYKKMYQDTIELIATLAERIGWKIAVKDTDIGTGQPGMIMGKNDYVFHVLASLDLYKTMEDDVGETEESGSEGYAVFENGDEPKEQQ